MFDRDTTAAEIVRDVDLTGQRAIVTGGASGIGIETARALAGAGAEVTLAVRDTAAGARVADRITRETRNAGVHVAFLDLADPVGVGAFAQHWDGPLHMLINNAGVMAPPLTRTGPGWELQFATNHLGHLRLATGLHRALASAGGARVVSVSSGAHRRSPVVFEDIHYRWRRYERWAAYGQSKTANVLFAVEAAKRWARDGIDVNALNPGAIRTNLQRYVTEADLGGTAFRWKTPEQGAATSVLLAASPTVKGVTGRYFEDCAEAGPAEPGTRGGVAAWALDEEAAAELWTVSERTLR
ncbi:SDR family NAD(P)-dependent oxidoreductase [Catenuloplanes atrovinosus]|uniref:Probable oxidoreductase n=1 Tax=Catenuloplanes atrovinosus TaxID=137266 RepID=A0AAE3YJY8_9ACTN|nr:SDR family NAD(P)-dependent oxidoreductase [Catenuloplanes atrovinosus]MDR7274865.1 NAD(P)-dependent dehydrogenase (short-subunit alcohol dehydrogenase family) [Catenuloplanes atrovinosus]